MFRRRQPAALENASEGILTQSRDADYFYGTINWCTPSPEELLHYGQTDPIKLTNRYSQYPIGHVQYLELLDFNQELTYLPSVITLELPYKGLLSKERIDTIRRACGNAATQAVRKCFYYPDVPYRQVLLPETEALTISKDVRHAFSKQR